jgi:hypothetical protein
MFWKNALNQATNMARPIPGNLGFQESADVLEECAQSGD